MGYFFLLVTLVSLVSSNTCSNDPDTLKALKQGSETVVHGTAVGLSKVKIIEVLKSGEKWVGDFPELDLSSDHNMIPGTVGVFFGKLEVNENLLELSCALTVSPCELKNLRSTIWIKCTGEDHCTYKGSRIENGHTFEDYATGEECRCSFGAVNCHMGLCTCSLGGLKHRPGEIWKVDSCKECKCTDNEGVCSYECEEDVCFSFILPLVACVVVVILLAGFIAYRTYHGQVIVDLDSNLPPDDYTPLPTLN
eukprot:TRINITY_DN17101_c0_g1_i1.p1 TRINITY_DN17101_c0_g1~~TRINITY_DN17101_c0_g1_i1.p1  ORF type:complete len:260 (+),score=49.14 TRINITY_DN17101_c0_g1_i1:28-780(+)